MDNNYLQNLPEYQKFKRKAFWEKKKLHKRLVKKVGYKMARRLEHLAYIARRKVEDAIIYGENDSGSDDSTE